MHKQSEDEMVIVRIHGPWGISRIKIHKSDSLADLKRCISERVEGLEIGADDYLPKPFEPKELILRILNLKR